MASLRKRLATAKQTPNTHDNNTLPLDNNNLPLEYTRILTEDDFDRIRELRHQQLVEAALAKHGLKSASMTAHRRDRIMAAAEEEADEMLEFQVGFVYIHLWKGVGNTYEEGWVLCTCIHL